MDYPQLNLIFGLLLLLTLVINVGLRVLLAKAHLPVGLSLVSWIAMIVSILSAVYIETLFMRFMTPSFNKQIGLGLLIIGSIGTLVTISLYRKTMSRRIANILLLVQILSGLVSLVLAFGLYRSLVPL